MRLTFAFMLELAAAAVVGLFAVGWWLARKPALPAPAPPPAAPPAAAPGPASPLGLTPAQEQQAYTAASRTAATAVDLYAPGAGQGVKEAADAFAALFTGKQWGPPSAAPSAPAPKPAKLPDPCKKPKAQLKEQKHLRQEEQQLRQEWVTRHPLLARFTEPDLRQKLGGAPALDGVDNPSLDGVDSPSGDVY